MGRHGSARGVIAALTAAATLLVALPAAGQPAPERMGFELERSTSVEHRAQVDGDAASAPVQRRRAIAPRSSFAGSLYADFCDDATADAVDLYELFIGRNTAGDLLFELAACDGLQVEDLEAGLQVLLGTVPEERMFLLDIWSAGGQVHAATIEEGSSFPTPAATQLDDDRVRVLVRGGDLGQPDALAFAVSSLRPDGSAGDHMPELEEDVGVWPTVCAIETPSSIGHTHVEPVPGRAGEARAAVADLGLTPQGPVDGPFSVLLAPGDEVAELERLDAVASTRASLTYQRADVPVAEGPEAWWRSQARLPQPGSGPDGRGVTIAVVDDGVDGTRTELDGRVAAGFDSARGLAVPAGANSSRGAHGNHVAGLAAAASPDVVGVAPGATVRPYQTFSFDGCATDAMVLAALDAAIEHGVDVINLSLGSSGPIPSRLDAALDRADQAGIVVVAAAGNSARVETETFPGSHPSTIAVGATRPDGTLAGYSTRAPADRPWLDVVAPGGGLGAGQGIVSLGGRDGELAEEAGTSMAAPIVSGAAAVYLAAGGDAFRRDVRATARPLEGGARLPSPDWGYGRLHVRDLVARAASAPSVRDIGPVCSDAPRGRFSDVGASVTHALAVDCVAWLELASGFGDGTFRPGAEVRRGQMATFVTNLLEAELDAPLPIDPDLDFPDVPAGDVHRDGIRKLATAGVVGGFPDGTFQPSTPVTRGQMARFLVEALELATGQPLPSEPPPFSDHLDSRFVDEIAKVATAGITAGGPDGRYDPGGPVIRGQMASFLARSLATLRSG